jgi:hypothetical protein
MTRRCRLRRRAGPPRRHQQRSIPSPRHTKPNDNYDPHTARVKQGVLDRVSTSNPCEFVHVGGRAPCLYVYCAFAPSYPPSTMPCQLPRTVWDDALEMGVRNQRLIALAKNHSKTFFDFGFGSHLRSRLSTPRNGQQARCPGHARSPLRSHTWRGSRASARPYRQKSCTALQAD